MINPQAVNLLNIRDKYSCKMSHLCTAEQTAVQVEQTKQGVRSPPPPHQKRICIYGALPRLPLGNAALFLKRQGHRELSFGNTHFPIPPRSAAYLCSCTATSALLRHRFKWKRLIKMIDSNGKALSRPAATGAAQRRCSAVLFGDSSSPSLVEVD